MALYDRIIGRSDLLESVDGKIPVHAFSAIIAEFGRGRLTGAQAQTAISDVSGSPLAASEITEAQTLLATISGTTTAKLARVKEIDDVLMLGEFGISAYDTPTEIKTRLGV
jgi:hypothetical protein